MPIVDATHFPVGAAELDLADAEHLAGLPELQARARAHVESWRTAQPIRELVFAFGQAPIVAVFLVRFEQPIARGELAGETEMWAIAGDVPEMCFETIDAPTPADALRLYCAIAADWARTVLGRRDLSQCYPITAEPTREHAKMLLGRVKTLKKSWVPLARRGLAQARKAARRS